MTSDRGGYVIELDSTASSCSESSDQLGIALWPEKINVLNILEPFRNLALLKANWDQKNCPLRLLVE